jgi:hypothetical protein
MIVLLRNDHLVEGMSGIGKLASATASGISPDLNVSTILSNTFFTRSFILTSFEQKKPAHIESSGLGWIWP